MSRVKSAKSVKSRKGMSTILEGNESIENSESVQAVNSILSNAIENSAAQEETLLLEEELFRIPSIITIAIISHGQDMPNDPFFDENVRILSYAGRSGSVTWLDPKALDNINKDFDKHHLEYQRGLPTKSKKKYIEKLYEDFPNANKCQRMPDFHFLKDGSVTPISSYNFLKSQFLSEATDKDGAIVERPYNPLEYLKSIHNNTSAARTRQSRGSRPLTREDLFTIEDAESALTHRMYTPVINKLYQFSDSKNPTIVNDFKFGIHVIDICNYDQKQPGRVNIKVGDNLLKSKTAFNRGFSSYIESANNIVSLQYLCEYLHSLGFNIINIIDVACRAYKNRDFTEKESLRPNSPTSTMSPKSYARNRISLYESLKTLQMNRGHGLKTRKKINKKSKKSRSKKSRSKN